MSVSTNPEIEKSSRVEASLLGMWIGDALAMPAHWYYNRSALDRDYGRIVDFLAPKEPHPDSILWRSRWDAPVGVPDILGEQRRHWGQRGVHYHRNLQPGQPTLTGQFAAEVWASLQNRDGFDSRDVLMRYVALLSHPERHRDTYLEECHRGFFTNLARGLPPTKCAVKEKHVGGLVAMLPVALYYFGNSETGRANALSQLALTHAGSKMKTAAEAILALLYHVLEGMTLEEAIGRECATQRNPHFGYPFFKWLEERDERVIGGQLSTACYVEDAVPAVIYLALKYSGRPEAGLVANTNLGGDNVHRGSVLGALLGAEGGVGAWPQRWREGLRVPATDIREG